jgi:hypothetical protein
MDQLIKIQAASKVQAKKAEKYECVSRSYTLNDNKKTQNKHKSTNPIDINS